MCFILIAVNQCADYPFILAANRDEFYQRKSSQLKFWDDKPHILGGRDLEQGGTWMGVNRSARFAAITNFREPKKDDKATRSRGLLISNYLDSKIETSAFHKLLKEEQGQYDGLNLVYGELPHNLYYFSNRTNEDSIDLSTDVYALSNHLLDTPWPKAVKGKQSFQKILKNQDGQIEPLLLDLLGDETKAAEDELPKTGIDIEFEQLLSSIYIESEGYGTRCSSVLMLDKKSKLSFTELTYKTNSDLEQNPVSFSLQL